MPIGYRFCPTDEEIIIHYLRPKVFSLPLPATAILHSDHFFLHHPSRLPGDPKEKRYFFYKPSSNNNNTHGSNLAGYWKPIIKNGNTHKLILATGCNHPIGFKKSFVFHQFNDHRRSASKTPWILHQFSLLYPLPIKIEEWVVCSIHMKSKHVKNQHKGPAKRLKKSHFKADNIQIDEECISPVVIDDDSLSEITFNEDLSSRKDEDEDEEESRVN
ncbi:NAC domain-containing protein 83-like [Bidens hawaiensis]|uniref:NAC domain-containing protein 83-like n=1 Tax=Bidens hawaiensis TaxID=980011 RepID=UPI00404A5A31